LTEPTLFGTTPVLERNTVVNRIYAQQLVYSGGGVKAGVTQAQQGYLATSHIAKATQADVITNVAEAYFRARQAKEAIGVLEASVKSLQTSYDASKSLHDSGMATNSDTLRAEVALTAAKENLITANNDYNVALAGLRAAMGLPQDAPLELAPNAVDTAPDTALNIQPVERPEISAQTAAVKSAEAGKKAAKAGRLPSVSLTADYFNEPVGAEFPRLSNTLMAGVLVRFNMLDGGLTRANINEADAATRKAREDLQSAKRQVEFEQQTAKLNLASAQARVDTTTTQVRSAEESLRALQAGYKEGMTPLTDVLAAEAALSGARVSRLVTLYDLKIAQINLLRAYGQTDTLLR
jgi:outer membrane protein TolC